MSLFDTDILESKTVTYKNREFTVYEMSAYDRVYSMTPPAATDDPKQVQINNYQLTESLLALAFKPAYPDKTEDEIKQALKKLPDELLTKLWIAAAEVNHIPLSDSESDSESNSEPDKRRNKKK
ncbi:hypothetical protein [Endozoicomonas sp. Mp262]|uniref:hypothetical protein n=1 Tax=Endozoicomonas sp. Mp262 TaxID=2919499 RepID=UPI0021D8EF51